MCPFGLYPRVAASSHINTITSIFTNLCKNTFAVLIPWKKYQRMKSYPYFNFFLSAQGLGGARQNWLISEQNVLPLYTGCDMGSLKPSLGQSCNSNCTNVKNIADPEIWRWKCVILDTSSHFKPNNSLNIADSQNLQITFFVEQINFYKKCYIHISSRMKIHGTTTLEKLIKLASSSILIWNEIRILHTFYTSLPLVSGKHFLSNHHQKMMKKARKKANKRANALGLHDNR